MTAISSGQDIQKIRENLNKALHSSSISFMLYLQSSYSFCFCFGAMGLFCCCLLCFFVFLFFRYDILQNLDLKSYYEIGQFYKFTNKREYFIKISKN